MKIFGKKNTKQDDRQTDAESKRQRVYSYYAASSQKLNTFDRQTEKNYQKESSKRKLRLIFKNWLYILIGAVLAMVAIYSITLNNDASVTISGTKYRQEVEYSTAVNEALQKSWLNMLKPTINKTQLEEDIKKALPEASIVQVSVPFIGHRPDIKIYTDKAMAIFSESDTEKYVLSERGRVLLPVGESVTDSKSLPVITNKSGIKLEEGKQFITPNQAEAIRKLIFQSATKDTKTISLQIPLQPQEVYFTNSAEGNYYVKFMLDPDTINQQYGAYLAVINKLAGAKPTEYIDARLADKIFVK